MRRIAFLVCLGLLICGCGRNFSSGGTGQAATQPEPPISGSSFAAPTEPSESSSPPTESKTADAQDWRLILVNHENPLPAGFTVALASTSQKYELDARILSDWEEMYQAAQQDGVSLLLCYGYRTLAQAEELFEKQINRQMAANGYTREQAVQAAKRFVAPPGYSEHHTGLALDIITPSYQVLNEGYAQTDAAQWLKDNAHHFGFILRYPKDKQDITNITFEPWHYRFVGKDAAQEIYSNGLCLEEYLDNRVKNES